LYLCRSLRLGKFPISLLIHNAESSKNENADHDAENAEHCFMYRWDGHNKSPIMLSIGGMDILKLATKRQHDAQDGLRHQESHLGRTAKKGMFAPRAGNKNQHELS
jgi:hypothetical protein